MLALCQPAGDSTSDEPWNLGRNHKSFAAQFSSAAFVNCLRHQLLLETSQLQVKSIRQVAKQVP